jgi:hypothetical protein
MGDITATVTFNLDRGSDDFDPFFLFNDGSANFIGFQITNQGAVETGLGSGFVSRIVDANDDSIGESASGAANTGVELTFGSKSGSGAETLLNRNGTLKFSFWLDDAIETGSINSLSINVEGIPEPSAGFLCLWGALSVAMHRSDRLRRERP